MENIFDNPVVAAAFEAFSGRLGDTDAVDAVQGFLDLVRAEIHRNAALHAEAVAQFVVARRRFAEALLEAASELGAEDDVAVVGSPELLVARAAAFAEALLEAVSELGMEDDLAVAARSELAARAAAYVEVKDRVERALQLHVVLVQALGFVILLRVAAYAWSRAPLIPGVLATAAAAYALAYAASGGAVVPGPASLVRIAVLLLLFLFGFVG